MNFGAIMLALLLVCGSVFLFFAAAVSAPIRYNDTYNTPTSAMTNRTQDMVVNGTAPAAAIGGGVAIILAVLAIIGAAAFLINVFGKRRQTGSYR